MTNPATSPSPKSSPRSLTKNGSLLLLAFLMGVCGMGFEYTFSKLASDLLGQTVTQWAIIIGLMMFAMGLGADFQKRISDHLLFEKFVFLEILLSLLGGFGALFLIYVFGEFRDYFVLVQYGISFTVGFIIGMEIPILARLNENRKAIKFNLAQIFKLDYFGGFVGALLWALVLVRINESILQVAFILSMTNLGGVLLAVVINGRSNTSTTSSSISSSTPSSTTLSKNNFYAAMITLVVFNLMLNLFGFLSVEKWTPSLEQKLFRDRVIYSKTTTYQHIVITESKSGTTSLYINGNLQFSSFDEKIYHEWLVHPGMLLTRNPQKVLILGGGDGLALREVLKYPMVKEITLVELDPEMIRLAREQPQLVALNQHSLSADNLTTVNIPLQTPTDSVKLDSLVRTHYPVKSAVNSEEAHPIEVKVLNFDAVKWVAEIEETYDLIILDFPDPHSLELSQLYALTFYQNLGRLLRPGGILVQQSSSPIYVKETFLLIGRTLEQAGFNTLPYQATVPSFGPWGWWMASKEAGLKERWLAATETRGTTNAWPKKIQDKMEHLTPELMRAGTIFPKNGLTAKKSGYNTILNHRAYRYYLEDNQKFWW